MRRVTVHVTGEISHRQVESGFRAALKADSEADLSPVQVAYLYGQYCDDLGAAANREGIEWLPATGDAYFSPPLTEQLVTEILLTTLENIQVDTRLRRRASRSSVA
ncbi:hypothetical protein GCM10009765_12680 [Fodinicola feengrottensis]|uniref:Uncharacterized protein n=1 Tax=Fodinicola feengrottensis TaxID=435914 RepID=A0ABP4S181_9ACTN